MEELSLRTTLKPEKTSTGFGVHYPEFRYDLWEPRLQLYGNTAIVSYTFMLSTVTDGVIDHRSHNESRVLIKDDQGWKIVHTHKSPSWEAPYSPPV